MNNGCIQRGCIQRGCIQRGCIQRGCIQRGCMQRGCIQRGCIQRGCIQRGCIQRGCIQRGCIQRGCIQRGCIQRGCIQRGCIQRGCIQRGCMQRGCIQRGCIQRGCIQRGCIQRGCIQRGCIQRGCIQRGCIQRGCIQRGCIQRGCIQRGAGSRDFVGTTNQKAPILQGSFSAERRSAVHEQSFQPMVIPRVRNASFDYKVTISAYSQAAMEKLNEAKVSQDDPRLIQLIRDYYIEPPSVEAYHLDSPDRLEFSNGQTPFIDSRLNYMEGGFYVECGALNGEKGSNTLFFEKVRKWNGLLVEADPSNYQALKSKHRKAFTVNACLSPQPYPAMVSIAEVQTLEGFHCRCLLESTALPSHGKYS
ncbi:hypothetical protein DPMN_018771 [Dreissena polymorpha]|uniref:Uncharacterized protein n=1 Tax=Dreissena polymorpha TaxID=45954 RepID=A0A9D4S6P1_DREPO|nr:hypothetical protein DPMN_018771 [Dreissena polymorpha]